MSNKCQHGIQHSGHNICHKCWELLHTKKKVKKKSTKEQWFEWAKDNIQKDIYSFFKEYPEAYGLTTPRIIEQLSLAFKINKDSDVRKSLVESYLNKKLVAEALQRFLD